MGGILSLLFVFLFIMYGYRFLSRDFTDRREILHGISAHLRQVFSYFGGIAPRIAELWASTRAIWWNMLLAEALVYFLLLDTVVIIT